MIKLSAIVNSAKKVIIAVSFVMFALNAQAQEHHTPQGADNDGSKSHQPQAYHENIEQSSGYDTPKGGLMQQPWVYTLSAAVLVLIIGYIYKSNTDRDSKSESGVKNKTV